MIEFISYNGEQLPIRVSYFALKMTKQEMKQKTGKELSVEKLMDNDIELFEPLLFYALQSGYKVKGEKSPIKREQIVDILDECYMQFAELLPRFFQMGKAEGKAQRSNQKKKIKK